jgi:SAM-dependent methyltransferase
LEQPRVSDPAELQRRFYARGAHAHLQPRDGDFYAAKLVDVTARGMGLGPADRVLEVGAGFGRFSFALLERCASLVAADLSERALATLEETRASQGIATGRVATRCIDLSRFTPAELGERFRYVAGFFILHHLPDAADTIRRLAGVLAPGGVMAFVEPNRRNPLFLAQVACCPDMSWAEEKGMFRLSARAIEAAFRDAGLEALPTQRFGCFPPQLVNRFGWARALEAGVERARLFEPVLPFLLLRARATAAA